MEGVNIWSEGKKDKIRTGWNMEINMRLDEKRLKFE